MRKEYNAPEMEIVNFSAEEVMALGGITLSGTNPNDALTEWDWEEF